MEVLSSTPTVVRTLMGTRCVDLAIRCLGSLARTTEDPIEFVIHDDGTLTENDIERLRSNLPIKEVVYRTDADAIILPKLANHPYCLKYRKFHPLALKLFDVALMSDKELNFCDTDIYFVAKNKAIFKTDASMPGGVFMRDIRSSYCVYPHQIFPIGSLKIASMLNSGLFSIDPAIMDLDYLDSFLSIHWNTKLVSGRIYWLEQTCWALLAARSRTGFFNRTQLQVATRNVNWHQSKLVGVHLTCFKSSLPQESVASLENTATITREPPALLTPSSLAISELEMKYLELKDWAHVTKKALFK